MAKRNGPRCWIGIDEAGYGPNLGPLVMTAVVAAGEGADRPDLWNELAGLVDRAGGQSDRLWVDDSKRVYAGRKGRDRLRDGTLAVLASAGLGIPADVRNLIAVLDPTDSTYGELSGWLEPPLVPESLPSTPLTTLRCDRWAVVAAHARVVGPARFNQLVAEEGTKAGAHGRIFQEVVKAAWDGRGESTCNLQADKHGGRHRYLALLHRAWPDAWIERGLEGAVTSQYRLTRSGRHLEIEFRVRADRDDGLVALASMVSKYVRERWMEQFHGFWSRRVAGLRPTAGYPTDARRYRSQIETTALSLGMAHTRWWRER
ncbi:MAG: hypothetical protein KatS3mg108_1167 [Isosphaeraceae bacterium]|nr:MAG: hypothetical protein KatS3mg108_1167 [Isosphaeraceae bacterium]